MYIDLIDKQKGPILLKSKSLNKILSIFILKEINDER